MRVLFSWRSKGGDAEIEDDVDRWEVVAGALNVYQSGVLTGSWAPDYWRFIFALRSGGPVEPSRAPDERDGPDYFPGTSIDYPRGSFKFSGVVQRAYSTPRGWQYEVREESGEEVTIDEEDIIGLSAEKETNDADA